MADVRSAPETPRSNESAGEVSSGVFVRPGPGAHTGPLALHAGTVAPAAPVDGRGFRTLLQNHLFLRLWMAQLISQTIMNAANYAMIVLVTNDSNSSLATSGAIVAFSLPALLLGAPAGVLVDRFDRRLVLWVSNVLRALATVVFIATLALFPGEIWPVYGLTFFIAMIGQFFTPAEGAAIPRLVHRKELMNALALFNITFTIAQAGGLIILGPLALLFIPSVRIGSGAQTFTVSSVMILFMGITLLYLVCAALILSIPHRLLRSPDATAVVEPGGVRRRHEGRRLRGIWRGILEAWHFITGDALLHISVWQLTIAGIVVSVVAMIAPRFVQVYFHRPAALAAMVFVPAGVGLVLGSAATPNIVRRLKYGRTVALGIITLAASITLLVIGRVVAPYMFGEQWPSAWPYLAVMLGLTFLIGIGLDLVNVPAQTLMQERSPDWIKGRVLAAQIMLLNGIIVVFIPAVGWIADHAGLSRALLTVAAAIAIPGLASVWIGARKGASEAGLGDSIEPRDQREQRDQPGSNA